jgi:RNase P subunit RPR2
MIIFGFGSRTRKTGSGQFTCPRCGVPRSYTQKKARRYFTLYFIPLIPLGELGEFIECDVCHTAYQSAVLTYKAKPAPRDLAAQLNDLKYVLEGGTSVEYALRDLTAAGLDREVARESVRAAIGTARRVCPQCQLHYAVNVSTCKECGTILQPEAP